MRAKMQLIDSASYLFDSMERLGDPNYTPNQNDILRARLRTSGIVEKSYKINNVDFKSVASQLTHTHSHACRLPMILIVAVSLFASIADPKSTSIDCPADGWISLPMMCCA
jgi:hypothetical protein